MANKIRNKVPEFKLIIEATKACKLIPKEIIMERVISKNFMPGSKHSSALQIYPVPLSAHSPQQQDILAALLAKHTIRTKNSENFSRLYNRPKTVSNLKNKKEVNTIGNETNEKIKEDSNIETLPKFISNSSKKDAEYIGDYELGIEIGRGTYAAVRLAQHKVTAEKVI